MNIKEILQKIFVKLNLIHPADEVFRDIHEGKLGFSNLSQGISSLSEEEKQDLLKKFIRELENEIVPVTKKLMDIARKNANESKLDLSFDEIRDESERQFDKIVRSHAAMFSHNIGNIVFTLNKKVIYPEPLAYALFIEICLMILETGELLNHPDIDGFKIKLLKS